MQDPDCRGQNDATETAGILDEAHILEEAKEVAR
jgi:hypothetical protein